MPQSNHAGFEGIVTFNGVDYNVDKWNITETTNLVKVTNTSDYNPVTGRCYTRNMPTTTTAAGSVEFNWDSNNDPYPAGLSSGAQVPAILNETTGHKWNFPKIVVGSYAEDQGGIDGIFRITISFENQSGYTKV